MTIGRAVTGSAEERITLRHETVYKAIDALSILDVPFGMATKYKVNLTHPVIATRLPKEDATRFDRLAELHGLSRSQLMLRLVMQELNRFQSAVNAAPVNPATSSRRRTTYKSMTANEPVVLRRQFIKLRPSAPMKPVAS